MGWNGSGQKGATPTQPKKVTPKKPSPVRGLIAGGAVVVLVAVAYFAFFSGSEKPQAEKVDKGRGRIKEVMPAAAPTFKGKEEVQPVSTPKFDPIRDKNSKLTDEQKDALYEKRLAETPLPEESTNRTFRTGLEQAISWMFTTPVGAIPPPLPDLSDYDLVHIDEILNSKNPIRDTDDDDNADAKSIVDYVKKELKDYLEKGGDPQGFLAFYHSELERAHQEHELARNQVFEVMETEPDIALDYLKKVNESLKQKGIKPVEIGTRELRRRGIINENEEYENE